MRGEAHCVLGERGHLFWSEKDSKKGEKRSEELLNSHFLNRSKTEDCKRKATQGYSTWWIGMAGLFARV